MSEELDVLKIVSERLETGRVAFMLTGSFALGAPKLGIGAMLEELAK